jgi:hypothetical protein
VRLHFPHGSCAKGEQVLWRRQLPQPCRTCISVAVEHIRRFRGIFLVCETHKVKYSPKVLKESLRSGLARIGLEVISRRLACEK